MSTLNDVDVLDYRAGAKSTTAKELARAYVPSQRFGTIYSPDESLKAGTVFPELFKPYESKCKR